MNQGCWWSLYYIEDFHFLTHGQTTMVLHNISDTNLVYKQHGYN